MKELFQLYIFEKCSFKENSGGGTRLEVCRIYVRTGPDLWNSGTLRETQCEKNQPLEGVIFGRNDP